MRCRKNMHFKTTIMMKSFIVLFHKKVESYGLWVLLPRRSGNIKIRKDKKKKKKKTSVLSRMQHMYSRVVPGKDV
jgi:hypothetical protein